jgi:hypothetical protein
MNRRAVLLFVFALLTLSPVLGLTAGLARANSDIPTPSGSYTLTGFGDTQTISLNCTSTFCDFSGYGTSLRLSRTEDFSEITSRWIRDNKVMLAGGEIVTSGRFHSANVPEYPAISQYWIPSSIGNFRTSDFETIYRSNVEGGGGTLQGPNGPQTSPKGYLLVHWIAPRLFFNLTWNAINPTANCFANVSGCANTQIGMVAIGETTTTTTITATTIAPATTEVATTTIAPPATEVATTTTAPPATEVATTTVPRKLLLRTQHPPCPKSAPPSPSLASQAIPKMKLQMNLQAVLYRHTDQSRLVPLTRPQLLLPQWQDSPRW